MGYFYYKFVGFSELSECIIALMFGPPPVGILRSASTGKTHSNSCRGPHAGNRSGVYRVITAMFSF
jgi:hypothetical protein